MSLSSLQEFSKEVPKDDALRELDVLRFRPNIIRKFATAETPLPFLSLTSPSLRRPGLRGGNVEADPAEARNLGFIQRRSIPCIMPNRQVSLFFFLPPASPPSPQHIHTHLYIPNTLNLNHQSINH